MKNFIALFDARGRLSRGKYWLAWLIIFLINFVVSFLVADGLDIDATLPITFTLMFFQIILGVKRMHDVGYSGWYILVPIYNLVLLLTPGEDGPNDYGPDPLGNEGDLLMSNDVLHQSMMETEKMSFEDQLQIERDSIKTLVIYSIIEFALSFVINLMFRFSENFIETYQSPMVSLSINFIEIAILFYFLATVRSNNVRGVFVLMALIKLVFTILYAIPINNGI